jgi:nitrogen fixation protein NifU and related proteins
MVDSLDSGLQGARVSDQLYGGVILERFRRPHHFGELPGADAVYEDVNPLCGDRLRVEVRFGPARQIEVIRFQGDACAIATASADLLAEMVEGRPAGAALGLERDVLVAALGAPIRASRLGCVSLPLAVLRGALGAGADRIAAVRGRDGTQAGSGHPESAGERR